jgi:hypothetical protein
MATGIARIGNSRIETTSSRSFHGLSRIAQSRTVVSSFYVLNVELVPGATLVQLQLLVEQTPSETTMLNITKTTNHLSRSKPCLRLVTKRYASHVAVEKFPNLLNFLNQTMMTSITTPKVPGNIHLNPLFRLRPRKLTHTYPLAHWRQALQPLDLTKEGILVSTRRIPWPFDFPYKLQRVILQLPNLLTVALTERRHWSLL